MNYEEEKRKAQNIIGSKITAVMDRPLGTYHPKHKNIFYTVNYGYVPGVIGGDGAEQDVYLLGVEEPVESFVGVVIAVVYRHDDVETKWVMAPEGVTFTKEEISEKIQFQEQFFQSEVVM